MEDRFSAIRAAIGTAGPNDVVVILGRGHKDFMEYGAEDVSVILCYNTVCVLDRWSSVGWHGAALAAAGPPDTGRVGCGGGSAPRPACRPACACVRAPQRHRPPPGCLTRPARPPPSALQGSTELGWFDDRVEARCALSKLTYLDQLTELNRSKLPWGDALDEMETVIDPPTEHKTGSKG